MDTESAIKQPPHKKRKTRASAAKQTPPAQSTTTQLPGDRPVLHGEKLDHFLRRVFIDIVSLSQYEILPSDAQHLYLGVHLSRDTLRRHCLLDQLIDDEQVDFSEKQLAPDSQWDRTWSTCAVSRCVCDQLGSYSFRLPCEPLRIRTSSVSFAPRITGTSSRFAGVASIGVTRLWHCISYR